MVAFFSILLAVILLSATVYGLHRYQTMEVEYTVDRSMPLPPLETDEAESADSKQAEMPKAEKSPATNKAKPEKNTRSTGQTWLNEVASLKKAGQLDRAMEICQREFPLWGAYNQACIIERLRLKKTNDSATRESILQRLYHLAASAELLHDKSDGAEHLTPIQLKSLELGRLDELRHAYEDIGYAHLRLIRKSDVKEMLANWGRPEQHQLPRQVHGSWWREFTARIS